MCYAIDPLCRFPLTDCRERVWLFIIELKLCVMRLQVFTVAGLAICGRGMWRCSESQSRSRTDSWLFRDASILTCAWSKYGWITSKFEMLQVSCYFLHQSLTHQNKPENVFAFFKLEHHIKIHKASLLTYNLVGLFFCGLVFRYIWSFGQHNYFNLRQRTAQL